MKLSITQIVLGVLIVLAACYVVWWMIFGVAPMLTMMVLNENGVMVTNVTPENEVLFTVARYTSVLLFGFGLVVMFTRAFCKKAENTQKLAMTQIVVGVLIVAVSVFILRWGYALDFVVGIAGGPVLDMGRAKALTILTTLMGLAVIGVGIAQYMQTRRA